MADHKFKVVVVDGIIGAGKTTIIKNCLEPYFRNHGARVTVIYENVEDWVKSGALQQFYDDPSRRGYQFQTMAFHDRIVKTQKAYRENKDTTDIFILERSIFTDVLFMKMLRESKTIDESEYRDYMNLWTMWSQLMPFKPDLFIYLRPDLDEAMNRLRARNRDGETGVSLKYQTELQAKHDEFLGGETAKIHDVLGEAEYDVPILKLMTNGNFRDDDDVKTKVFTEVKDCIYPNVVEV